MGVVFVWNVMLLPIVQPCTFVDKISWPQENCVAFGKTIYMKIVETSVLILHYVTFNIGIYILYFKRLS